MAMLYTHAIGNQPWNTMAVFKVRESVPTARYSPVCNVLRQWKTSLILTYRVYRLYDYAHANDPYLSCAGCIIKLCNVYSLKLTIKNLDHIIICIIRLLPPMNQININSCTVCIYMWCNGLKYIILLHIH